MVGKGGRVEFRGRDRTVASRLQARPPQPVARRVRLEREKLEPVQGADRVAGLRLHLLHHLRLHAEVRAFSLILHLLYRSGAPIHRARTVTTQL